MAVFFNDGSVYEKESHKEAAMDIQHTAEGYPFTQLAAMDDELKKGKLLQFPARGEGGGGLAKPTPDKPAEVRQFPGVHPNDLIPMRGTHSPSPRQIYKQENINKALDKQIKESKERGDKAADALKANKPKTLEEHQKRYDPDFRSSDINERRANMERGIKEGKLTPEGQIKSDPYDDAVLNQIWNRMRKGFEKPPGDVIPFEKPPGKRSEVMSDETPMAFREGFRYAMELRKPSIEGRLPRGESTGGGANLAEARSTWNSRILKEAKELKEQGKSYQEVADDLGMTREAVKSQFKRQGLTGEGKPGRRGVLSEKQIDQIIAARKEGAETSALAERFGVPWTTISKAVRRRARRIEQIGPQSTLTDESPDPIVPGQRYAMEVRRTPVEGRLPRGESSGGGGSARSYSVKMERRKDLEASEPDFPGSQVFTLSKEGKTVAQINISPRGKELHIDNMFSFGDSNSIGKAGMRDFVRQVKEQFPDAILMHGYRISGARSAAGKRAEGGIALKPEGKERLKEIIEFNNARRSPRQTPRRIELTPEEEEMFTEVRGRLGAEDFRRLIREMDDD